MKSKKTLRNKLDKLWSEYIRLRAKEKCEYCGKPGPYLNSHHIYSRSKLSTRWDENNGVSLCSGHHTLSSGFSAHKTPLEFVEWLYQYKGQEFMDKLRFASKQIFKPDIEWYEQQIVYFESCLKDMR